MSDLDAIRERDHAWFEGHGPVTEEGRMACHDRHDLIARVAELEAALRIAVEWVHPVFPTKGDCICVDHENVMLTLARPEPET